jgi:PQQ-like domain
MRAISIRCPTCNASLRVASDAAMTTCEYCHTTCRIQTRTGWLQRPASASGPPGLPVAQAPANHAVVLALAGLLTALLGTGAAAYLMMRNSTPASVAAPQSAAAPVPVRPPEPARLRWTGSPLLLRDLDGDGNEDLIGIVEEYLDRKQFLAAYSGVTGREMWRAAVAMRSPYPAQLALTEAYVLRADDDGRLYSYLIDNGEPRWVATLGEKVEHLCAHGPGQIRVITADAQVRTVQLEDGAVSAPTRWKRRREAACDELPLAWHRLGMTVQTGFALARVPGMSVRFLARRGAMTLAAGGKSPGTAVPMLARLDGKVVTWKRELPSDNPLGAQMREDLIYFDEDLVAATYKTRVGNAEVTRLVALASSDGTRRWEVPSSECRSVLTRTMVLCIDGLRITAYHRNTGNQAFQIGN